MNGFLLGSNGCGITILFFVYASGGKLCYYYLLRRYTLLGFVYSVAMSREGLVSIVLVGLNGDIETRRLRRDSVFFEIFAAYVDRVGMTRRSLGSTTLTVWLNGIRHRPTMGSRMRDGLIW